MATALLGTALGCAGLQDLLPGSGLPIETTLTSEQKETAEALALLVDDDAHFDYDDRKKLENADVFLWLAANKLEEPTVLGAALEGMEERWTTSDSVDDKKLVNADYHLVVRHHLDAEDTLVLARAIEASTNSLVGENPHGETVDRIVELATLYDGSAGRYAALDELWQLRDWEKQDGPTEAFYQALASDDAYVVSNGLNRLKYETFNLIRKDDFRTRVLGLLSHDDPGVRGRAATVIGRLAEDGDEEVGTQLHALLNDPNPYVRGEAAEGLAELKRLSSVHKMIAMLDDSEKASYTLDGWTKLDGTNGSLYHDASTWSRVDDALLYALVSMTSGMGDDKFEYRKINSETKDADIALAVKDAQIWYKANVRELPAADAEDAPERSKARPGRGTAPRERPGGSRRRPR